MQQPGFTTELKNNILRFFFVGDETFLLEHTPVFAGLFIDQQGPEPNELIIGENGYARALVTFALDESASVIKNAGNITFPVATSDWGTDYTPLTHLGLFASHLDAETETWISTQELDDDGKPKDPLLAYLPLIQPETVGAGEVFQLNPNAIKLQLI